MHSELPIYLRSRDFDKNSNLYIGPLLAFYTTVLAYGPNLFSNCKKRKCLSMRKCQILINHYPYTTKTRFAKQSVQNKPILLKEYTGIIGNTSRTAVKHLIYNDIILSTNIAVLVHCNRNTRKSEPWCSKTRQTILKNINKFSESQRKEFDLLKLQMKESINRLLLINKNNNNILYKNRIEVRWTDLDHNKHVSQSSYGEYIDNTLYQYDKDYNDGKLWLQRMGITYDSEITLNSSEKSYCLVTIYYDHFDENNKCREIVGEISQNNRLCGVFSVIFKQRLQNKL
eukprot:66113_1